MSSAGAIQALLRFLSQDAKIPLATAMGRVKELQQAGLGSPAEISKSNHQDIQKIFPDEKLAKQVLNAAKRVNKKRASTDTSSEAPAAKKPKAPTHEPGTPAAIEESLELPSPSTDDGQIRNAVFVTNRAPLVLAFAVTLLKYTMPEQPISSRLSLAQAVVSANSRSKAISIGLESGKSAEAEGWGEGQPIVKVMGREIRVMKRWGYEWKGEEQKRGKRASDPDSRNTPQGEDKPPLEHEPALWGLDLEALKKENGPSKHGPGPTGGLPIYPAQSARAYLLRSFDSVLAQEQTKTPKKQSAAAKQEEKERNLGLLLGALDLLYQSWADILDRDELDRRAWNWYVNVRPDVASGAAGWGGKNQVKLAAILDLRR